MPLYDTVDPKNIMPSNPNLREIERQSIAVDSKFEPPSTLLTHVEGAKWVIPEYYSQYMTEDDESASQEIGRPAVYQQYLRIKNLEMRVTMPLTQSMDTQSKEFTVVGTATLYPGLVPANGNVFLADVGDGRIGIFVITEIRQKTILRNTTYEIEYELKGYDTDELLDDLRKKISKDTYFVRDFYKFGKNPLLIDSEYEQYQQVLLYKERLPRTYYDRFFNHDLSTLLIPNPESKYFYDPFVTELMSKLVDRDKVGVWRNVKLLNRDIANHDRLSTVWDSMFEQNPEILNYCSFISNYISVSHFSAAPRFASLRYSGVKQVYYPKLDKYPSVGDLESMPERVFNRPVDLDSIMGDDLDGLNYPGLDPLTLPMMKPVTVDEYYVFSKAFYDVDYPNMSLMELMVTAMLDKKPIGIKSLFALCKGSTYWGDLEQFYYLPVLLLLLHVSIGDIN